MVSFFFFLFPDLIIYFDFNIIISSFLFLSLSLSLSLSLFFSVCLSVFLFLFLSVHLTLILSTYAFLCVGECYGQVFTTDTVYDYSVTSSDKYTQKECLF